MRDSKLRLFVFFMSLFFLSTSSFAQNFSDGKRTTSINFDDELIEGEVKKPELIYLLQKKQFNYKKLIKLRKNFLSEMRRNSRRHTARSR